MLKVPAGLEVRPTTGRMRDWICNVLRSDFEGRSVLDLFAGSGSLGIHALSLGARHATFLDISPRALKALGMNLQHLGIGEDKALVQRRDALRFLRDAKGGVKVDLVFVDPPYDSGVLDELLPILDQARPLTPGGLLVLEHPTGRPLAPEGLTLYREKAFGRSTIRIYRDERDQGNGSTAAAGSH